MEKELNKIAGNIWATMNRSSMDKPFTFETIDSALLEAYQAGLRRAEEKYQGIFNWLLGIEGEFPNLAEKPHYRFRTELRERLTALSEEIKSNEK